LKALQQKTIRKAFEGLKSVTNTTEPKAQLPSPKAKSTEGEPPPSGTRKNRRNKAKIQRVKTTTQSEPTLKVSDTKATETASATKNSGTASSGASSDTKAAETASATKNKD